jgi:hypothetical protein
MTDYPTTFPLPQWNNFQINVNVEPLRSSGSAPEQRLRTTGRVISYAASIVMSYKQYGAWLRWMNINGGSWFNMLVTGPHTPANCAALRVRLSSDISITQTGNSDLLIANFSMEHES